MNFVTKLRHFIYPKLCVFCTQRVVADDADMCDECAKDFAKEQAKLCPKCSCAVNACTCEKPKHISKMRAVFWYEGMIRNTVLELKSLEYDENFEFAARRMSAAVRDDAALYSCDYICYVPRTALKTKTAGHDTAKVLAERISESTGIPVRHLLSCVKKTDQKTLTRAERFANIRGAFTLNEGTEGAFGRALIVDDVITTGATAEECAKVLLHAGASEVCGLFFARTRMKD